MVSAEADLCELCAAGMHQDVARQSSCKPCDAGYSCAQGAAVQTPCAKGSFTNSSMVVKDRCAHYAQSHLNLHNLDTCIPKLPSHPFLSSPLTASLAIRSTLHLTL